MGEIPANDPPSPMLDEDPDSWIVFGVYTLTQRASMTDSMQCPIPAAGAPEAVHPLLDLDPEALKCPHGFFSQLRDEGPVTWLPQIRAYAVTHAADITAVLRQPEIYSSSNVMGPDRERQMVETMGELLVTSPELTEVLMRAQPGAVTSLLNADPPLHGRQRSLVNRGFTPRRIRDTEPLIRSLSHDLIDRFAANGQVDLVGQFAVPLPLLVIADRLGVPDSDLDKFKAWSDEFIASISNQLLTPETLRTMLITMADFYDYFATLIEQRRLSPTDDLLSVVANAEIDGDQLEMPELLNMCSQFLVAGSETTTKLITSTFALLLPDRSLYERVRSDHSLIPSLVEEALRLEPPVQGAFRLATVDTKIGDVDVPAGSALWLVYASGNRDKAEYASPEDLDLDQAGRQHLAFGFGEHYCLGAALARLQTSTAIEILLDRLPELEIHPDNTFEYELSYFTRGLRHLDLTFTPGTASSS